MPDLLVQGTAGEAAQAVVEFVAGLAKESQSTQNRYSVGVRAMSGSP